jgi:hypothetical protein
MKPNEMETRASEDPESTRAGARTETDEGALYWGVLCRRCRELVAFDTRPYLSFGPGAASMKPGAIRCSQGHNHIYFPQDFGFRASAVPIADAAMRHNRELYGAVNSLGRRSSHDCAVEAVAPAAKPEDGEPEDEPENGKAHARGHDPRREAAQTAAKDRWTNWAERKKA